MYDGSGHPALVPVAVHSTTANRVAQQKNVRNRLAAAVALKKAEECISPVSISNIDTTIINHPGTRESKHGAVSWKRRQLWRKLNRNVTYLAPRDPTTVFHTQPFKSKLFCGIVGSGRCLPFLLCLEAPGIRSDQYEFFDLEGFHVREDIKGHVVAVQNMHSSVMSAVYKHYFLKICFPSSNRKLNQHSLRTRRCL